jgi:hypothetical protein
LHLVDVEFSVLDLAEKPVDDDLDGPIDERVYVVEVGGPLVDVTGLRSQLIDDIRNHVEEVEQ